MALETLVRVSIGIEIRPDVATLSSELLKDAKRTWPSLERTEIVLGDIRAVRFETYSTLCYASIVYSHNKLFVAEADLAIEKLVCRLRSVRYVVLSAPF